MKTLVRSILALALCAVGPVALEAQGVGVGVGAGGGIPPGSAPPVRFPFVVSDLDIANVSGQGFEVTWTAVPDFDANDGSPVQYALRYGTTDQFAGTVIQGWSSVAASEIVIPYEDPGEPIVVPISGLVGGTSYTVALQPWQGSTRDGTEITGEHLIVTTDTTTLSGASDPDSITYIAVASVGTDSVVAEVEVPDDGTSSPAKIDFRIWEVGGNWGEAYVSSLVDSTAVSIGDTVQVAFRYYDGSPVYGSFADPIGPDEPFVVRAVPFRGTLGAGAVFGPWSEMVQDTTAAGAAPLGAGTITATSAGATSVFVDTSIEPSGGVGSITRQLHVSTSQGFTPSDGNAIAGATSASHSHTGLSEGVTYYYRTVYVDSDTPPDSVTSNEASATPTAPGAGVHFDDGFETGDLSHTTNGFSWLSSGMAASTNDARTGSWSARGFYPQGDQANAGLRWSLGTQVRELWIEWYIKFPVGYTHGPDDTGGKGKFLRVWGQDYSFNNKVGNSTTGTSGTNPRLENEYSRDGGAIGPYGSGSISSWVLDGEWVQVRWHGAMASSATANDGVVQIWRNGSLLYDRDDLDIHGHGEADYWSHGYFMGAQGQGMHEDTQIFIDDVTFYTSDPGW